MTDTTVSPAGEKKADTYLTEGKMNVTVASSSLTLVEAHGSSVYSVKHQNGVWTCDCPARVSLCAHVVAAQKIVHRKDAPPELPHAADEELDTLLGERQEQATIDD